MTIPVLQDQLTDFIRTYRRDPVSMVRDLYGVEPDDWQKEVLEAYAGRKRRISIRSAHGTGKTAVTSWMASHHILSHFPQKTAITAPSSPQLFDAFWAELLHWLKMLPEGLQGLLNIKADKVEFAAAPQSSFITARTSRQDQPEALQGIHSDFVLIIVDEASGVPERIYEAAAGSMSGENACTILIGNPIRTSGLFYDTHNRLRDEWETFHVSGFDSPRVSQDFIDEMARRYGDHSNVYRCRVLGEFPLVDDDTVISFELVEEAQHRDVSANPEAPTLWGVDVARFGGDRSTLCKRKQNVVLEPVRVWRDLDLMQLTGALKTEWDDEEPSKRPTEILVDVIGIGAGVVDRLRELGLPCRGVNVSESPAIKDRYRNLRAELWFLAKEWFSRRDCRIPLDSTLSAELTAPKYTFTSSGKLQVESKEEMKKRGLPSPDAADAFVLTFAGDAAVIAYGGASRSWGEPIHRKIKGIV